MARRGDDFHRLIEHLERATAGNSDVTIEAPKYIRDKVTGEMREHDIILTYRHPHRTFTVAMECRDRSTKVGSPEVEAFQSKCNDTGRDKKIIVSSRGFSAPAVRKATQYNIECLLLEQVEQLSRVATAGMQFTISHINDHFLDIVLFEGPTDDIKLWQRNEDGTVKRVTTDIVNEMWHQLPQELFLGENGIWSKDTGIVNVEVANPEIFYIAEEDGSTRPIKALTVCIAYRNERLFLPFRFHEYKTGQDQLILEAGSTEIFTYGDTRARGVLALEGDQLRMSLVQEKQLRSE